MDCQHESTRTVGDMPIANPETYEFEGRFNVKWCDDCHSVVERLERLDTPNGNV